jgi:predicted Rossmann fold nucleotide-binding protein DprA/Smf involved in DNA uptake
MPCLLPGASRVAITGIRDLSSADTVLVEEAMGRLLEEHRTEIRFGGARGVDTVALVAAGQKAVLGVTLTVIVPGTVVQQPVAAQKAIRQYAHKIEEMKLPLSDKSSYQRRNIAMIAKADGILAFWHGWPGGTANCILSARKIKLPVEVVWLRGLTPVPGKP